jgi:hypothetical protein
MNNKQREFAPKGAWAQLSAHGNSDVIQMATPRAVRSGGSDRSKAERLKVEARAKGIIMVDGLTGLSEEGALELIRRIPPIAENKPSK